MWNGLLRERVRLFNTLGRRQVNQFAPGFVDINHLSVERRNPYEILTAFQCCQHGAFLDVGTVASTPRFVQFGNRSCLAERAC